MVYSFLQDYFLHNIPNLVVKIIALFPNKRYIEAPSNQVDGALIYI